MVATAMFRRILTLLLPVVVAVSACGDRTPDADEVTRDGVTAPATGGRVVAQQSATLAAIKRRGRLNCGVHEGLVGFAYTDNRGQWRGFDVDFCRALAAAVSRHSSSVGGQPTG